MANPRDQIYVDDILAASRLVQQFMAGKSQQDFCADPLLSSAVTRQLEIIGEAAKRLSEEFKNQHPAIPWRDITGMRDVLIHDYIGVDLTIVWNAATQDLPALQQALANPKP